MCVKAGGAARLGSLGLGGNLPSFPLVAATMQAESGIVPDFEVGEEFHEEPKTYYELKSQPLKSRWDRRRPATRTAGAEDAVPPRCGAAAGPCAAPGRSERLRCPPRPGEASCAAGRPFSASCHNSGVVGRQGGPGPRYVKGIVGRAGPRCHAGGAPAGYSGRGRDTQGTGSTCPPVRAAWSPSLRPPAGQVRRHSGGVSAELQSCCKVSQCVKVAWGFSFGFQRRFVTVRAWALKTFAWVRHFSLEYFLPAIHVLFLSGAAAAHRYGL